MSGSSIGNLSPAYQLRQDRVRRIFEAYRSYRITQHEFRKLMEQEGHVVTLALIGELSEAHGIVDTFEPLADVNARLVRKLH